LLAVGSQIWGGFWCDRLIACYLTLRLLARLFWVNATVLERGVFKIPVAAPLSSGLALSLAYLRIVDRMPGFVVVYCGARSFSWWWGIVCHAIRDLVQI
jgi:hypothetical protein